VTLRPAGPEDGQLLWELYRASRLDEVSAWGWDGPAVDAFLRMQWQIEQRARTMQHPGAQNLVVVVAVDGEERPVGRLLVDRTGAEIAVIDLALLPDARGLGVGTVLLRKLLTEASGRGVPVVLSVLRGSRAERLYRRLGFVVTGEDALRLGMAFPPTQDQRAQRDERGSEEWQART
jgi:GNAT superfamily N-acetyltransferase